MGLAPLVRLRTGTRTLRADQRGRRVMTEGVPGIAWWCWAGACVAAMQSRARRLVVGRGPEGPMPAACPAGGIEVGALRLEHAAMRIRAVRVASGEKSSSELFGTCVGRFPGTVLCHGHEAIGAREDGRRQPRPSPIASMS